MKKAAIELLNRIRRFRRFPPTSESLVMLIVLALAIAAPVLYYFPKWQADTYVHPVQGGGQTTFRVDKEYFDVENESRKTLAQIVLGGLGLVALYLTWVRSHAQHLQARVAEQAHFTDRFTKAIEQLGSIRSNGSKSLEVRLGAIYSLERLARDSEKDHWTIIEILCAYVRENAPWQEPRQSEGGENEPVVYRRTDVQAALTVIGRRERSHERETRKGATLILDLRWADLRGMDLSGAHLEGAMLTLCHLEGASLAGASFQDANFSSAHLERANLTNARLDRASLVSTRLDGATLSGTHFEDADLLYAHLEKSLAHDAYFKGAFFGQAVMDGAYLRGAHLEGACLADAHLNGANIAGAHLTTFSIHEGKIFWANALTLEQIKSTEKWQEALWSPEVAAELGLAVTSVDSTRPANAASDGR